MADDDTPLLPDSKYRVHDPDRPTPAAVTPGETTVSDTPPTDATVLFDGTDLDRWEAVDGGAADWRINDGALEVVPGTGDIRTTTAIGDCQLHVEWAAPGVVEGSGQGRGNSGVFLMERYEVQVLDCYENDTYPDGYVGAIYGQQPPLVNAARPPGEWQHYDILWEGPRFENGECIRPARITVLHNGVAVHVGTRLHGPTAHNAVREYEPHPPEAPLRLQDHGDRVRFRNIWYRPLGETPTPTE